MKELKRRQNERCGPTRGFHWNDESSVPGESLYCGGKSIFWVSATGGDETEGEGHFSANPAARAGRGLCACQGQGARWRAFLWGAAFPVRSVSVRRAAEGSPPASAQAMLPLSTRLKERGLLWAGRRFALRCGQKGNGGPAPLAGRRRAVNCFGCEKGYQAT